MDKISRYVDYLPPALWSAENDPSQFLGRMLRVFEALLTGVEADSTPIVHGDHQHDPLEKTIDELAGLFNPFRTRSDPAFLQWLASWVALSLQDDWSEYHKRWLISQMAAIYRQRGLKKGLYTYLDIYETSQVRPRIAIDDGEAILRGTFVDRETLHLHAVAHSHAISRAGASFAVLLHPSAVAVDKDGNYIVADRGGGKNREFAPALWKLSSVGNLDYAPGEPGSGSVPQPIVMGAFEHPELGQLQLENPTAVVVDRQSRYSVLDIRRSTSRPRPRAAIYRFNPPDEEPTVIIQDDTFGAVYPVDMVLDEDGRYIVLDRGGRLRGFPPQGGSSPKIIVVTIVAEDPLQVEVEAHDLTEAVAPEGDMKEILEPTAIVMDARGRFIVANANHQRDTNLADLIQVDPARDWEARSLLGMYETVDENPFIFPTGLAFESAERLLVCDTGVALGFSSQNRSIRTFARPAAIYRVDLSQEDAPPITRLTPERTLVNPTKMNIDSKGRLIITDQGEALRDRAGGVEREWRASPNEFGLVIHFSEAPERPLSNEDIRNIRLGIEGIMDEQKPGHTIRWTEL